MPVFFETGIEKFWLFNTLMMMSEEPELVIKQRDGSVLGKKTILKSDHFPGCHNKRLSPHIDGAPNFRQVVFSVLLEFFNCASFFLY